LIGDGAATPLAQISRSMSEELPRGAEEELLGPRRRTLWHKDFRERAELSGWRQLTERGGGYCWLVGGSGGITGSYDYLTKSIRCHFGQTAPVFFLSPSSPAIPTSSTHPTVAPYHLAQSSQHQQCELVLQLHLLCAGVGFPLIR
jgi:hypothetical protein